MSLIITNQDGPQWDVPIDPETYEGHDDSDSLEEAPSYLDIKNEIGRSRQTTFDFEAVI
jgi:hypothetical protein